MILESILEGIKMKITKQQLRRIIKEEITRVLSEEFDADTDPVIRDMLVDAGFSPDGREEAGLAPSVISMPGPRGWQLYSPGSIEEASSWIQAAIDMNFALRKADEELMAGNFETGQDAWYEIVYPVQQKYAKHGAADTEGREVAGTWLEDVGHPW